MTHEKEHVIIHKVKEFLNAPLPGGGKRWHVVVLCALCLYAGAKWF
jgi:hypothetical protein